MKYIPVSKDEPFMMKEDSYLGDMLTTCVDPEALWMMLEGSTPDFNTREEDVQDLSAHDVFDFPYHREGKGVQIPDALEGTLLYENGVVVNHTGKVLSPIRKHNNRSGVMELTSNHDVVESQYCVRLSMLDGRQRSYRVAALVLQLHGDQPQPTGEHTIWFKDNDFRNCTLENLRWVNKDNLNRLRD